MPVTIQAGLRVRNLALYSNHSSGYAFRARSMRAHTSPPALVILVRNSGWWLVPSGCMIRDGLFLLSKNTSFRQ